MDDQIEFQDLGDTTSRADKPESDADETIQAPRPVFIRGNRRPVQVGWQYCNARNDGDASDCRPTDGADEIAPVDGPAASNVDITPHGIAFLHATSKRSPDHIDIYSLRTRLGREGYATASEGCSGASWEYATRRGIMSMISNLHSPTTTTVILLDHRTAQDESSIATPSFWGNPYASREESMSLADIVDALQASEKAIHLLVCGPDQGMAVSEGKDPSTGRVALFRLDQSNNDSERDVGATGIPHWLLGHLRAYTAAQGTQISSFSRMLTGT